MKVTYRDTSYLRSNEELKINTKGLVGYKVLLKQLLKLKIIYESLPTVWELNKERRRTQRKMSTYTFYCGEFLKK